jgi:rhodanese-related sulfurtransferase
MKRLLLSLPFLAALVFGQTQNQKNLTPEEIEKALERKDVFFLDVREPKEIAELGSVKGYVNIPLGQLESRLSEVPKDKLVITL